MSSCLAAEQFPHTWSHGSVWPVNMVSICKYLELLRYMQSYSLKSVLFFPWGLLRLGPLNHSSFYSEGWKFPIAIAASPLFWEGELRWGTVNVLKCDSLLLSRERLTSLALAWMYSVALFLQPSMAVCYSPAVGHASDSLHFPFVPCQAEFFLKMFQSILEKSQLTKERFKDLLSVLCKSQVKWMFMFLHCPMKSCI